MEMLEEGEKVESQCVCRACEVCQVWNRGAEREKTIYLHAIIAFASIQNSIFLIWLKHQLLQVAINGARE